MDKKRYEEFIKAVRKTFPNISPIVAKITADEIIKNLPKDIIEKMFKGE